MCHIVYISTDTSEDLSVRNSEMLRFEKVPPTGLNTDISILKFPHVWFVGSKSGCSCTFRHLHPSALEFGFDVPQAWYSEDEDAIAGTKLLYSALQEIVSHGFNVDLLDVWDGDRTENLPTVDVSFAKIQMNSFRLFDGHRFRFTLYEP